MNLIDLKERIATADVLFSPAERDFLLDAVNAAAPAATLLLDPGNDGRVDQILAALSVDAGGEGLCAMSIGHMMMPLVATDAKLFFSVIYPQARRVQKMTGKPVRIVRFRAREDIESIGP